MDPNKRPDDMQRITTPELAQAFIEEQVAACREQIGDKKVLLALSGGVDSSVGGAADQGDRPSAHLRAREPRPYAQRRVRAGRRRVPKPARCQPRLRRRHRPLPRLARRRRRARSQAQDHRRRVHPRVRRGGAQGRRRGQLLAQGTIYPDILESDGVKAHHNVGGLPEDLQFELCER